MDFLFGSSDKRGLKWLNILTAVFLVVAAIFIIKPGTNSPISVDDQPLFSLTETEYSEANLPLKYSHVLHEIDSRAYQQKQRVIETAIAELYIEQQVTKGEDRQEVIHKLFDPQPATEEQLQQFYQQNQARIKVPYDQAKPQIAQLLATQQLQLKQRQLVEKLTALDEVKIYLTQPAAPKAEIDTTGFPSKGADDAKVTLVEFGDYQCSHCRQAHIELEKLLPPYLDRVNFVFMHLPVNSSGISRKVAEGAVCAQAQDKFWEYHDLAFQQQIMLTNDSPLSIAEDLGLDMADFKSCLADAATAQIVEDSVQQAVTAGVASTPSFFINGRRVSNHDLRLGLPTLLDSILNTSSAESDFATP